MLRVTDISKVYSIKMRSYHDAFDKKEEFVPFKPPQRFNNGSKGKLFFTFQVPDQNFDFSSCIKESLMRNTTKKLKLAPSETTISMTPIKIEISSEHNFKYFTKNNRKKLHLQ